MDMHIIRKKSDLRWQRAVQRVKRQSIFDQCTSAKDGACSTCRVDLDRRCHASQQSSFCGVRVAPWTCCAVAGPVKSSVAGGSFSKAQFSIVAHTEQGTPIAKKREHSCGTLRENLGHCQFVLSQLPSVLAYTTLRLCVFPVAVLVALFAPQC